MEHFVKHNFVTQLNTFQLVSANSYQNLFGEPAERARPLSKKVIKIEKPEPKQKKPKPLPGKLLSFVCKAKPVGNEITSVVRTED